MVRHAEATGHRGPLTTQLALQWAQQPQHADRIYWAMRLDIVRRFARFWMAYDPRTELPPRQVFGPTRRRRAVHVYTRPEVGALLHAAAQLGRVHPLRGATFGTLLALLDCTGLRIGEALRLTDREIDWAAGVLTIRHAKCGHARLIPVHPSTLAALRAYQVVRDKALRPRVAPAFFVTVYGQPLGYVGVSVVFRRLARQLGWRQPPLPRLHDLRHTFAVRTLLGWYQHAQPIAPRLWTLATYLGHRHLADTYWYLSAVPELMQLGQARMATAQAWASGGRHYD